MNDIHDSLISIYTTRGIGKLIKKHEITLSSEKVTKWKSAEIGKLLWSQLKPCVQVYHALQSLEKAFRDFLSGLSHRFSTTEDTVHTVHGEILSR